MHDHGAGHLPANKNKEQVLGPCSMLIAVDQGKGQAPWIWCLVLGLTNSQGIRTSTIMVVSYQPTVHSVLLLTTPLYTLVHTCITVLEQTRIITNG